jgi:hypothetical protein
MSWRIRGIVNQFRIAPAASGDAYNPDVKRALEDGNYVAVQPRSPNELGMF